MFVAYYSADAIALGCEAWLGPHYQISAQVNRVNPGGTAQSPHRDYHVGFYAPEEMDRFPRHVHLMSQALTLQGAVAHTDMALESGPTMLLPFSQLSHAGFIASLRDDFREVFHEFKVQLPMKAGRRGVLQPGGVPRRRRQRDHRLPAHEQPAPGVVGVRAHDGDDEHRPDRARRLPVPARDRRRARTRERDRGGVRGLRLPDQPRLRSADRRSRPAQPGRHRAHGGRRALADRPPAHGVRGPQRTARPRPRAC